MKFKYHKRPFSVLLRIAKYELQNVDHFLALAGEAMASSQQALKQIAEQEVVDDWLADDYAQLDDFGNLSSEFAIVGLWRCIELYRKRAMGVAGRPEDKKRVFTHKQYLEVLKSFSIKEQRIRCARSMNELRCLNNQIKHSGQIIDNDELLELKGWRSKKSKKSKKRESLGNLDQHYKKLRPLVERYLQDLTSRFNRWWHKDMRSKRSDNAP